MYKSKPIVVEQLFDADTYATIRRFMSEWGPLLQVESDLYEERTPFMFGRKWTHNTPFFVDIHNQLSEYASDIFGEKVKPSYVFLSMYENDGRCPLHIDRPQCRYTIDYLIQQEQTEPWPICIGQQKTDKELKQVTENNPSTDEEIRDVIANENWTTVNLNPNDAVCYSGTHAWHYRPEASRGTADLVFFHFVPWRYNGPLD